MFCSPYHHYFHYDHCWHNHHHHNHFHYAGCELCDKKKSKKQLEREKLRRDVDESIFKYALKTERRDHEIQWKNMHTRHFDSEREKNRQRSSSK